MTRTIISRIFALFSLLFLIGCDDYIEYDSGEIPEGESTVQFRLNFKDYTPALDSRSAGDAIKSINRLWVVIYNSDGTYYQKRNVSGEFSTRPNTRPDSNPQAETETGHAEFRMTLPNGMYRIYAVANMDLAEKDVTTEDKLRALRAEWNTEDVRQNAEMFGWFSNTGETVPNQGFEAQPVVVAPGKTTIHAWLYRLASKVTVAFDGSGLKDGVSVYLKKVRIRNVPRSCALGLTNMAASKDDVYGHGEEVVYSESTNYTSDHETILDNGRPYYPRVKGADGVAWEKDPDSHSEINPNSLFFYENMQGEGPDKKQNDENGDGKLDELYPYQGIADRATYIEVDAHYISTNPERPGICDITYRFMLGQDVRKDYNADRNCHYKLTLHLNGFADEPDWRIDYVTRLNVTAPHSVNYQGKYFKPDGVTANQGNTFIDGNYIHVESFMFANDSWEKRDKVPFVIEYRDNGSKEFSATPPEWLDEVTHEDKGGGTVDLKINYKNPFTEVDINKTLQNREAKQGIYDLATKGGTENINSANCYIVDSKGTYQFPLVYGNAIVNGGTNKSSYTYQANTGGLQSKSDTILTTFKNYLDKGIAKPYILEDIYGSASNVPSGIDAGLVWQDEQNLVNDIKYVKSEYNNLGAIRFTIGEQIKEGNAVIALKDPSGTIMWSWHIWVTALDLSKKITLTNHAGQQFDIMPVNLGWCSGNKKIRYYDRHECEVKITQLISGEPGYSQIVKIIQEPHISLPRGNNPYYQWGRKDPFVAAGNGNETNKTRYTPSGTLLTNPERMYAAGQDTISTKNATAALIRNPHKWQNCLRKATGNAPGSGPTHIPVDTVYMNLWDNETWNGNLVCKTVYDPCPAPYHVGPIFMFTGFVNGADSNNGSFTGSDNPNSTGDKFLASDYLYAVTDDNNKDVPADYKTGIFEFYIDRDTKLISIGFPQNGYRDWADNANVLSFETGELWLARAPLVSWGNPGYTAYHMEYFRNASKFDISRVWCWNNFNATNGFAVRPTISR